MQMNPLLIVLLVAIVWFGAAGIAVGVNIALDDEGNVDEEEVAQLVKQAVDDYVPGAAEKAVEGYVPGAGDAAAEKDVIARILLIIAAQRLVLPDAFKDGYFAGASEDDYDRCLGFLSGGSMSVEEGTEGFAACERAVEAAQFAD